MFDRKALEYLESRISDSRGVTPGELNSLLTVAFSDERSPDDLKDYRSGKRQWKKLKEEVSVVNRYFRYRGIEHGRVRFPLDSHPPDCWFTKPCGQITGIEVTIAMGRAKSLLGKQLAEDGHGSGFITLQDDADKDDFKNALSGEPKMYSTYETKTRRQPGVLKAVCCGIMKCLKKKNESKYEGMILLVEADLAALPSGRWLEIVPDLCKSARDTPFSEVHVVAGAGQQQPWGIHLKP